MTQIGMCGLFYSAITSLVTNPVEEDKQKTTDAQATAAETKATTSTGAAAAGPPRFGRSMSLMTHPRMAIQRFIFGMHQKTKRCLAEEAESGDETSLCSWIQDGYDPDEVDNYGYSPLLNAAALGRLTAVKELIDNGAHVNKRGPYGYTALHAAAQNGHREIVSLLLEHGAQINVQNDDQDTAMHLALAAYRIDVVFILVTNGGNVRIKGYGKKDCVEFAKELRLKDIAERLQLASSTCLSLPHTHSEPLLPKITEVN